MRDACTCGNQGICLTCQLTELNTSETAALIALSDRIRRDRFAVDHARGLKMLDAAMQAEPDDAFANVVELHGWSRKAGA